MQDMSKEPPQGRPGQQGGDEEARGHGSAIGPYRHAEVGEEVEDKGASGEGGVVRGPRLAEMEH